MSMGPHLPNASLSPEAAWTSCPHSPLSRQPGYPTFPRLCPAPDFHPLSLFAVAFYLAQCLVCGGQSMLKEAGWLLCQRVDEWVRW